MILTRALALTAALAAAPMTDAAEVDPSETEDWSGEGEFGLVVTSGNTESETLNANLAAAYEQDAWLHKLGLSALSASEEEETTAERYQLTGKSEYHTTERSYWFGSLRYEDDRFSGFDYQSILTGGYGYTVWEREASHLDLEAGVGVRRSKPALATGMTTEPEATSEAVARGAASYWWQFTENARLQNDLLVETGEDNTFAQNLIALRVAINSRFAVKLGYEVRHNTDVPAGTEETDTTSTINLVYSFK